MDKSEWDERSLDNYDKEDNLKESLMLNPMAVPEEKFTREGKSYYYTRTLDDGTVEPITSGSIGDTLKQLAPLANLANPFMGAMSLFSIGGVPKGEKQTTDWTLKDLAYPLNVPFGGKKQNNLGDWAFTNWLVNAAPSQLGAARTGIQAAKGKYFYRPPAKQPINVTPPPPSNRVPISSRTSSQIVRQHTQKAGFAGPEGEPLVRLDFTPTSIFAYDGTNVSKSAGINNIPRPNLDYFQSFRKEPHTATLTEDQYKQAWANYSDHSKKGWEDFQAEQGKFIVGGYKMKPPGTVKGAGKRITKEQVLEGIKKVPKDWSPNLTTSMDEGIHSRNMRASIATYWFGGTPATTSKASYKVDGKNIEPHHRTSHGEISPWTDVIIKKLQAPKGSKEYQEGLEMLEIGKDIFRSSPFFAGDVYENYEGYTKIDHTGKAGTTRGIHNKMGIKKDDEGNFIGYRVHGPGGKSSLDFPEYTGSKGIGGIPTKEYIQNLPFKREDVFKYRENIIKGGRLTGKYIKGGKLTMEGNTFFNTLYEWLRYSDIVKDAARAEIIAESDEPVGKNWAKGER